MKSKIETLKSQALTALKAAKSDSEVRDLEVKYLGRSGQFNDIMKSLKDLSKLTQLILGIFVN